MTSVLGYARTLFLGGSYWPDPLPIFREEVLRFHKVLDNLSDHLEADHPLRDITPEQLLQGPFSDAMSHAGQLAMLRRLQGASIPPENFVFAEVDPSNVTGSGTRLSHEDLHDLHRRVAAVLEPV